MINLDILALDSSKACTWPKNRCLKMIVVLQIIIVIIIIRLSKPV